MSILKPIRGLQLNKSHPLARGLVGCWLFNEGGGKQVFDSSGNGNNGILGPAASSPTWAAGKFGSSLDFDGTNDYLEIDDADNLSFTDGSNDLPYSISLWAYISDVSAYQGIIHKYNSSSTREWVMFTNNGDLYIRNYIESAADRISAKTPLIAESHQGRWIHIVAIYDGSKDSSGFQIYINGIAAEMYEDPYGTYTGMSNTDSPVILGFWFSNIFTGLIDHVMIFNRVLTPCEITLLHREPFCIFDRDISPAWLLALTVQVVNLAGTLTAQSMLLAIVKLAKQSLLKIERQWLTDTLFNSMTANAFKLGTVMTGGWFWMRPNGCTVLYRGLTMEQIDFVNIQSVAEKNAESITYTQKNNSNYFYVVRRFNNCGCQEQTLQAAVKVEIDAEGNLAEPLPNNIFAWRANQVDGNKIQLVWFHSPLEQKSKPVRFKIYYDGTTGQINYESPIAEISYRGLKFYSWQSEALPVGKYLFAIKAEDADSMQNNSFAQLAIEIVSDTPNAIEILKVETL